MRLKKYNSRSDNEKNYKVYFSNTPEEINGALIPIIFNNQIIKILRYKTNKSTKIIDK